jgi:hypothetical protein
VPDLPVSLHRHLGFDSHINKHYIDRQERNRYVCMDVSVDNVGEMMMVMPRIRICIATFL